MSWIELILMVVFFAGSAAYLYVSATRYQRRRVKEGAWDANGPKHPTDPPPNSSPTYGNAFSNLFPPDEEK